MSERQYKIQSRRISTKSNKSRKSTGSTGSEELPYPIDSIRNEFEEIMKKLSNGFFDELVGEQINNFKNKLKVNAGHLVNQIGMLKDTSDENRKKSEKMEKIMCEMADLKIKINNATKALILK
jgi:hypothetical protein